ncbi:hypothetical protein H0H87_000428 [Tephrocybe sp. NHM501043]|nr:hypothetical protein H0H87_000428 [Tephrocybe sp. NHM501043]
MGDAGKLYVAADVIPVYREITLTDTKLVDLPSLQKALSILHNTYHVPNVVISSIPLTPWLSTALPPAIEQAPDTEQLLCIASSSDATPELPLVYAQCVPQLPGYFSGVGDLFSALLLAHFSRPAPLTLDAPSPPQNGSSSSPSSRPVAHAAAHALATTHYILRLTHAHAVKLPEPERLPTDDEEDTKEPLRKTRRMRGRELRLVQGQAAIRGVGVDVKPMALWEGFWDA